MRWIAPKSKHNFNYEYFRVGGMNFITSSSHDNMECKMVK